MVADALSRSPVDVPKPEDDLLVTAPDVAEICAVDVVAVHSHDVGDTVRLPDLKPHAPPAAQVEHRRRTQCLLDDRDYDPCPSSRE